MILGGRKDIAVLVLYLGRPSQSIIDHKRDTASGIRCGMRAEHRGIGPALHLRRGGEEPYFVQVNRARPLVADAELLIGGSSRDVYAVEFPVQVFHFRFRYAKAGIVEVNG